MLIENPEDLQHVVHPAHAEPGGCTGVLAEREAGDHPGARARGGRHKRMPRGVAGRKTSAAQGGFRLARGVLTPLIPNREIY